MTVRAEAIREDIFQTLFDGEQIDLYGKQVTVSLYRKMTGHEERRKLDDWYDFFRIYDNRRLCTKNEATMLLKWLQDYVPPSPDLAVTFLLATSDFVSGQRRWYDAHINVTGRGEWANMFSAGSAGNAIFGFSAGMGLIVVSDVR